MNPELTGLRRIETTLDQLPPASSSSNHREPDSYDSKLPSFSIQVRPPSALEPKPKTLDLPKLPLAPILETEKVDPAVALDILQEIGATIARWQDELARTVEDIQRLYEEGPLVDGWLESEADCENPNFVAPSRVQGDNRLNYVEAFSDRDISYQTPRAGYRLCGIDELGRPWSQDCPSEDVADISLAIGRYQQLQQLLARKQNLAARLEGVTETLMMMRGSMDSL